MATVKVLTLSSSGKVEEQSIETGGGSGLTYVSGTSILNFSDESDMIVNTISNAFLTNANIKSVVFFNQETIETSLDDFTLNGVSFNLENIIDNISFDIRGNATNNASGNYTVKYSIGY